MNPWLPVLLILVMGASSCSALNREGPLVTCADLNGGAMNACKEGIIASCKDGTTVTYEVCDDGDACAASWQAQGAFRCTKPSDSSSSGAPNNSSGSSSGTGESPPSGSGDAGSSSDGSTSTPNCPATGAKCAACFHEHCCSEWAACLASPACINAVPQCDFETGTGCGPFVKAGGAPANALLGCFSNPKNYCSCGS